MRLILVGETNAGSRTPQRLRALTELGHHVTMVSTTPAKRTYESTIGVWERLCYRLRLPLDPAGANQALLAGAAISNPHIVILDNARMIHPRVLRLLRKLYPGVKLLWYSEDDTLNPIHRSRWMERSMALFDLWVTTKSFNAQPHEVPALGARRVIFVNNSFCRHEHTPLEPNPEDFSRWGSDISFVGTYESPRAQDLMALATAGFKVRVWGNGWQSLGTAHPNLTIEGRPVYGDHYRRVVASSTLNLCFLRKGNRDLQTCRSMELPAMGATMLHEASPEVEKLFAPEHEALYFSNSDELVSVARRWLAAPQGGRHLGLAARARAVADGHDHHHRWTFILAQAVVEPCVS